MLDDMQEMREPSLEKAENGRALLTYNIRARTISPSSFLEERERRIRGHKGVRNGENLSNKHNVHGHV